MNVSPDALRKETIEVLKEVETHLEVARHNHPPLIPTLLVAKSQCLNTLVLLNQKR